MMFQVTSLNDIPKEIKQNSTTYYLVNPVWNIAETEMVSNNEVPVKYNGTMYYEGVKTRTIYNKLYSNSKIYRNTRKNKSLILLHLQ